MTLASLLWLSRCPTFSCAMNPLLRSGIVISLLTLVSLLAVFIFSIISCLFRFELCLLYFLVHHPCVMYACVALRTFLSPSMSTAT